MENEYKYEDEFDDFKYQMEELESEIKEYLKYGIKFLGLTKYELKLLCENAIKEALKETR